MNSCQKLTDHNYPNFSKIQFLGSNDGQYLTDTFFCAFEDLIYMYMYGMRIKVAHSSNE